MQKLRTALSFITAALMPLAPFFYLYNRNSSYLDARQALLVAGGLLLAGLALCAVWKLLFRANTAAMAGCAAVWAAFFAFASVYGWAEKRFSIYQILPAYALGTLLVAWMAGFLCRKIKKDGWIPMLSLFLAAMLLMNGVPAGIRAVNDLRSASAFDKSALKTEFALDASAESPNVYWLHCDGMLGFQAMEKYFGDEQTEFKAQLAERGFRINENALLEAGHTTEIAVTALMCPAYCDQAMGEIVSDHEAAMRAKADEAYRKGELRMARIYNETVRAFAQKGYQTEMIVGFGVWFTPLVDRYYNISGSDGGYLLDMRGDAEQVIDWYLDTISWNEMAQLLLDKVGRVLVRRQLPKIPLSREIEKSEIARILLDTREKAQYANLVRCLNDSFDTDKPTLRVLNYEMAHYPYAFDENGAPHGGDGSDILRYGAHHTYAAKALINILDLILANDPQAVIVLQADHGLHGQELASIEAAFGAGAETEIWNSVLSAIRVPEKYQTDDIDRTMETPLNIARYLVNRFVGENYPYIDRDAP